MPRAALAGENLNWSPVGPPSTTGIITNIMSSSSPSRVEPLPAGLEGVVSLNAEYRVLLCPKNECRKAVAPTALSEHLRKIHHTKLEVRRQVEIVRGAVPAPVRLQDRAAAAGWECAPASPPRP